MKLTTLDNPPLDCGEGALWDPARRRFLWTNAMGQGVYSVDAGAASTRVELDGRQVGSIALHHSGGFVLGGAQGVWVTTTGKDQRWLAPEVEGRQVGRINEVSADPAGRVFAAQEMYDEDKPYVLGCLFRFDPDGRAKIVEEGVHIGNGMGFSPDRRTFYFTDSFQRTIFAYDYRESDGSIRHRRVAVRVPAERGLPDGLAVDAEGFLWSACWFGGGVARYDPEGKLERFLPIPAAQVSSVAFGGKDLSTLLVTSAGVRWESKLAPPGHDFNAPRGGATFGVEQEIVGQREFVASV